MSLSYHVTGWISVLFFTLALSGVAIQLRAIWRRKHRQPTPIADTDSRADVGSGLESGSNEEQRPVASVDRPTAILSLNQFFASFLAFYSFLVYGICSAPFNHYLVWTRLPATLLAMLILFEIWHDRRSRLSLVALVASMLLTLAAVEVLVIGHDIDITGRSVSSGLAVFAAAVFGQGLIHQIIRIRETGHTGAVSLTMHQLTTYKDGSTILFALTMPWSVGWPLMVVGGVGVLTKSVLMWQFRWVRLSPQAAARRAGQGSPSETDPSELNRSRKI